MNFSPSREVVEAILVLRNTKEFQTIVYGLRLHRNQLLLATMDGPSGDYVDRLRHRAGGITELLGAIDDIETLRQQYDTHGATETSTEAS